MVYAVGLAETEPHIDATSECGHCAGGIVWDVEHGWLHLDGWYACRQPVSGSPREVMAQPAGDRP